MDQRSLEACLADLPLPDWRYFASLASTNDEALRWAEDGAPELALVIADEQTAGRGRAGRRWVTAPGSSLAFSLIFHPPQCEPPLLPRYTALGAVAVCSALSGRYALEPKIKWPNDVLLADCKVGGVLAEAHWDGERLKAVILGIGINVAPDSVREAVLPRQALNFPAACVEAVFGRKVHRQELLHETLRQVIYWRERLESSEFLQEWESRLALRGEWVRLSQGEGLRGGPQPKTVSEGQVLGLAPDGSLKLLTRSGKVVTVQVGEIRLLHPQAV